MTNQERDTRTEVHEDEEAIETRRSLLLTFAGAFAAVGIGNAIWPLINFMAPSSAALASQTPLDVNLSGIEPGRQKTVQWRGLPIFVVRRTSNELSILRGPQDIARLADPNSKVLQQPKYADNWHRSIKPEYLVLVGVCTHLGCIPQFKPRPGAISQGWLGGYFCPCHGSKYDLSGRVYKDVPAPYNLPVPPYRFLSETTIRVGENPKGSEFALSAVQQL